ncbi:MAG: hypothetical protein EZS28_040156, partial [Streblomastix strix]
MIGKKTTTYSSFSKRPILSTDQLRLNITKAFGERICTRVSHALEQYIQTNFKDQARFIWRQLQHQATVIVPFRTVAPVLAISHVYFKQLIDSETKVERT